MKRLVLLFIALLCLISPARAIPVYMHGVFNTGIPLQAGYVTGLKVTITDPANNFTTLSDIAIENQSGLDIVSDLTPHGVVDDDVSTTAGPLATSFDDLSPGEYGINYSPTSSETPGELKQLNDCSWDDGVTSGTSDPVVDCANKEQSFSQNDMFLEPADGNSTVDFYFKFSNPVKIKRVKLVSEKYGPCCQNSYQPGSVRFYDQDGNELSPYYTPAGASDYLFSYADQIGAYNWDFNETPYPAPTVNNLEIDIQYTSGSVYLSDVALYEQGSKTDFMTTLTSVSESSAVLVSSFYDLLTGEYGTNSVTDKIDSQWNNGAWDIYGMNTGPNNIFGHQSESNSSGLKAFLKFSSAKNLETVALYFCNTDTEGNPRSSVVFKDEGGNVLTPTRQSTSDSADMNFLDTYTTSAGCHPYFWQFANKKKTETAPIRLALGAISGTNEVGETLSVTHGSWDNAPTDYSYQLRNNGSDVTDQTDTAYTVTSNDAGDEISWAITATNASGSTTVYTAPVYIKPYFSSAPTMTGTFEVGQSLACDASGLLGEDSTSYVWQNNPGSGYTDISGATSNTYITQASDENDLVRCGAQGTNSGGTNDIQYASAETIIPSAGSSFDISSTDTTSDASLDVSGSAGDFIEGIAWVDNDTKVIVDTRANPSVLYLYSGCSSTDISICTYASDTKSLGEALTGLHIIANGSRMYAVGNGVNIERWSFGTAFTPSTLSKDTGQSFNASAHVTDPQDVVVNSDETKLWVLDSDNSHKAVVEYSFGTAGDVTTLAYVDEFDISGFVTGVPRSLIMSFNYSTALILGSTSIIYQCSGAATDISSFSYNSSLNTSPTASDVRGIATNSDQTAIIMTEDNTPGTLYQYDF